MLKCAAMDRKKRTVISLEHQSQLDFDEAEHSPAFTFPEYQRSLIGSRIAAGALDFGIVGLIYLVFVVVTYMQMPAGAVFFEKRVLGIYGAGYLLLVAIYFFLFMLSGGQTIGMRFRQLVVVTRDDQMLDPRGSCVRGFGYFISIMPLMLGFVWALIDPEHLTWADKVSGTFVRKL